MTPKIQLQEAFKLALSLTLFYWLALYMDWDLPKFGALAIVVISLSTTGASLNKGIMRVAGTGFGALAGFVLLSWFAQSPLGMLLATAIYLVFVGYFIQTTRQGDTWFNAGLLAVAVWSSSYMQVDTAFHFATIRFLETATGVLLFTVVSTLLWPRTSGAVLQQQGQTIWEGMQELFKQYRQQLATGSVVPESAGLRTRLAGEYQQLLATLEAAYSDTYKVSAKKAGWEILRKNLRSFGNAQELWRESINDCRELDPVMLLPDLEAALDTLNQRLERGYNLWEEQKTDVVGLDPDDAALMSELVLKMDARTCKELSHFQQAAMMNFVSQLQALDRSSRELLQTLRVLANLDPESSLCRYPGTTDPFQASAWNPERLFKALFPAICWIAGYAFWFYVNPPGGPAIPMMSAVLGLMIVMAPANLLGLLIVLLLSMFIAVAPVYLFLMPTLDSGFSLLALIFVYTFVFAWLGGRSPILKLGPLLMFIMMVNINNQQGYSFIALVTAGLVMLLGISIVVMVHRLSSPMHPEKVLLRSVRRFLIGNARIIGDFRAFSPRQQSRGRKRRKRIFETAILPISSQLMNIEKHLDYPLFPENTPDKVQYLANSLHAVRLRLQTLEANFTTVESESPELMHSLEVFNEKWSIRIRKVLGKWARLEHTDNLAKEWNLRATLLEEMEQQLNKAPDNFDRQALGNFYAVLGSTQSLLEAIKELGNSMQQINWNQWAVARF